MTIENSEDTAQVSVPDPAEVPVIETASGSSGSSGSSRPAQDSVPNAESTSSAVIEVARNLSTHDSSPPLSRKLAPPPKPKRDSGMTSSPPPGQNGDAPDLLASGANALKAPIAPTISYSADETAKMPAAPAIPEPALVPSPTAAVSSSAPLSQPPPIPRRRSSPVLSAEDGEAQGSARTPSEPSLSGLAESAPRAPLDTPPKGVSAPPRPITPLPARPAADVPAASAAPAPAAPSSSAIFAMRIIAVGDSVRPPVVQESTPDLDPDSYPPSASRLGTSVRRSSRPVIAAVNVPVQVPPAAPLPTAVSLPSAVASPEPVASSAPVAVPEVAPAPAPIAAESAAVAEGVAAPAPLIDVPPAPAHLLSPIEEDIPIEVEAPVVTSSVPPVAGVRPPPPPPPVELGAVPREELREVLGEDLPPDSDEKTEVAPAVTAAAAAADAANASDAASAADAPGATTTEAEELGREDAISLPPEELAALKAELDAKAEAVKPPPPPKRTTGVLGVAPPVSAPGSEAPPKEPPPTPDPAAAKAAQRAKTRQPWWEDLFNEDFMRASSRVSDEQIRREVTFIEESLGVAAGGVVLDLGCGAGHHAVEFASRGYGVVGYDLSLYQLALAADVAQERSQKINFLQGDMREMAFEEMFDGVFCWNTTFGYFEEDKNLAVAQRVFKALRPGGMFLIDVLNRDFAAASAPCSVWYEGDSCVCMDDMSVDYISSRLRVKRSIILDDGRTKESLYSLRLYSLHELGKLLHEVGFRVTEASGHPSTPGVFFGPNSPRIIMLAQRP